MWLFCMRQKKEHPTHPQKNSSRKIKLTSRTYTHTYTHTHTHWHAHTRTRIHTQLIHMCGVTHSDSFVCVTWLIRMCDVTHSCTPKRHPHPHTPQQKNPHKKTKSNHAQSHAHKHTSLTSRASPPLPAKIWQTKCSELLRVTEKQHTRKFRKKDTKCAWISLPVSHSPFWRENLRETSFSVHPCVAVFPKSHITWPAHHGIKLRLRQFLFFRANLYAYTCMYIYIYTSCTCIYTYIYI